MSADSGRTLERRASREGTSGQSTGFMQYPRVEVGHRPIQQRIQDWHEIDQPLVDRVLNEQAARCMDCGIPYCHAVGCPLRQPDSRVQRAGLPRPLAGGGRESALDQQLSRDHRPRLSRPLRSGLHAGLERPGRQHQADRVPDRRAGVRRGLGPARCGRSERPAGRRP